MLRKFWSELSNIGVLPFTNEGTKFEINSINQLSAIAFLVSFIGFIGNSLNFGIGAFQYLLLTYSVIFLLSPALNALRQNLWAKIVVFYNFQVYHLLLGLTFGLSSQAQIIYVVAIVFIFLFFSEEPRWQQFLLMLSTLAFPAMIFAHDYDIYNVSLGLGAPVPPMIDVTVYFTSLLLSLAIMYMAFGNLRKLVKKYTRKNIDLLNTNAALKAKVQERTDLFAQVIHDLKSPVHSLVGLASLLDEEKDTAIRDSILAQRNHVVHELHQKVEDELNRFKDEKYELELEPVNIENELQQIFNLVRFYHGFRKVKLKVNIDQQVPLYTDIKYINVILGNLVSNAIKYADFNKQPYLAITGRVTPEQASLRIEDNGIGIPRKLMPYIFNKLFRATDYGEGSGIGLSLVKKAIETLGGDITLDSEEGKGTSVHFTIINLGNQEVKAN